MNLNNRDDETQPINEALERASRIFRLNFFRASRILEVSSSLWGGWNGWHRGSVWRGKFTRKAQFSNANQIGILALNSSKL